MNEFLSAAKRFEQDAQISLYDLGVALMLEYFAAPLLIFTRYQPLLRRPPTWEAEMARLRQLSSTMPPAAMEEALVLIGRGLDQRRQTAIKVYRLAIAVRCLVAMGHIGIVLTALFMAPWLIGGWLFAMTVTMVVCLKDHHWSPRGGFRRSPG